MPPEFGELFALWGEESEQIASAKWPIGEFQARALKFREAGDNFRRGD